SRAYECAGVQIMKIVSLFLAAGLLSAAEPDWNRLEKTGLEFFQQYLRIQSVDPPADTRAAASLVKGLLEHHGIAVQLLPSGPTGQVNVLARVPGRDRSKKPLLLLNHLDVVPVDRKAWEVDPFGAIIRNGEIWGRGTMDMKGIGTEHMMALVALKEAGITPAR